MTRPTFFGTLLDGWKATVGLFLLAASLVGCATFYARYVKYEGWVQEGKYQEAVQFLVQDKYLAQEKNALLRLFEQGRVAHLAGEYALSNRYFNQADSMLENYRLNAGLEALSFFTNPQLTTYKPEDFEKVAIHWYKALNNIFLNNFENARVEARRIDLQLQQLNDRYRENKNLYDHDALASILMGLIFESIGETDNAFVSYRNAYELFAHPDSEPGEETYMGVPVPDQLKKDLIRMAAANGYRSDVDYYRRRFGMSEAAGARSPSGGELVVFLENGMGPYKDQIDVVFTLVKGKAGFITFNNEDLGITLPVYLGNDYSPSEFSDIKVVRVAFPQYKSRVPIFQEFSISDQAGHTYALDEVQNYNAIAKACLKDRFLREAGTALLRLAIKQASEIALRKENETAGAVLGLLNALTEQADTRNWQTLPARIYYRRIPLQNGLNKITITERDREGKPLVTEYEVEGFGGLQFLTHYSLESEYTPTEYYYNQGYGYQSGY